MALTPKLKTQISAQLKTAEETAARAETELAKLKLIGVDTTEQERTLALELDRIKKIREVYEL